MPLLHVLQIYMHYYITVFFHLQESPFNIYIFPNMRRNDTVTSQFPVTIIQLSWSSRAKLDRPYPNIQHIKT